MTPIAITEIAVGELLNSASTLNEVRSCLWDCTDYVLNVIGLEQSKWNRMKTRLLMRFVDREEFLEHDLYIRPCTEMKNMLPSQYIQHLKGDNVHRFILSDTELRGRRCFIKSNRREIKPLMIERFTQDLFMPELFWADECTNLKWFWDNTSDPKTTRLWVIGELIEKEEY